jgi:putative spermidine/putrescine transport system ATP-binding protein
MALFRSESAELESSGEPAAETTSDEIVLSGRVMQVSYPGGTWRHAVAVGEQEVQVDSPCRYEPDAPVRIRLPSHAVFMFPRSLGAPPAERRQQAAAAR